MSATTSNKTESPKINKPLKSSTVINCMMTPSYPSTTAYSPYAVVSPVLLPYVQAPVQYIKGNKSKKATPPRLTSSPAKVRYVPAYTYTPLQPQYICYKKQCLTQSSVDGSLCLAQRLGIPFAMRINPDAQRLNHGYVSALTPPAVYLTNTDPDLLSRSELNPLSRPYTPPNRVKQCTCGEENGESNLECSRHELSTPLSDSYSLDCDGSSSDSRSGTPTTSRSPTPTFSSKSESNLSDTDSGVEGGCDEDDLVDNEDGCYDVAENRPISIERLDSVSDLELKYSEEIRDSLPSQLTEIVDFLCLHLDSHEWRTVAREMGVNDVLIQSVEYDFYDSFRDQMKLVFTHWANLRKSDSTSSSSELTSKALTEIGRADLVELLNDTSSC